MFRVTVPSNIFYVTPEQLPRFLANLSETRYVTKSGEFLQTTSIHEPAIDITTATLLIKQPVTTARQERDQFQALWLQERTRAQELEDKLNRAKVKKKVKKPKEWNVSFARNTKKKRK